MTVRRYHPMLAALHWLLALLIIGQLLVGALVLSDIPDQSPDKLQPLRLHLAFGLTILALMVVRLITRFVTKRPAQPHDSKPLRTLAVANHWAFYLVIFAMLSTGLGMAQQGGLFPLLEGKPVTVPDLHALQPHEGHELFGYALLGLIALHLAGVAYHYGKGEKLLARMGFGPRDRIAEGDLRAPEPAGRAR